VAGASGSYTMVCLVPSGALGPRSASSGESEGTLGTALRGAMDRERSPFFGAYVPVAIFFLRSHLVILLPLSAYLPAFQVFCWVPSNNGCLILPRQLSDFLITAVVWSEGRRPRAGL